MIKVKTIERFTDGKEDKVREVNDEFEVSQKRLDEILAVGKLVKVVEKKNPNENSDDVKLEDLKRDELLSFAELNLAGVEVPAKEKSEKVADYEERLRNFIYENLESGD